MILNACPSYVEKCFSLAWNTSHPDALIIPDGTTTPMITAKKEEHRANLRLFQEVKGVEKALIQQIVKAVEPTYLAALRNRSSNSLLTHGNCKHDSRPSPNRLRTHFLANAGG